MHLDKVGIRHISWASLWAKGESFYKWDTRWMRERTIEIFSTAQNLDKWGSDSFNHCSTFLCPPIISSIVSIKSQIYNLRQNRSLDWKIRKNGSRRDIRNIRWWILQFYSKRSKHICAFTFELFGLLPFHFSNGIHNLLKAP